jgi:hypothetical protein
MVPAIIDFEASGLGRGSYPIEVGYILEDGRSACYLIRPEPDWSSWCADAQRLHGIPRALLQERARPVREVASLLNAALAGRTLYTDAWGNDYSWMSLLFDAAGLVPRFRLQPLSLLLTEAQQSAWGALRDEVAAELALVRHRASTDARVLQATWLRSMGVRCSGAA